MAKFIKIKKWAVWLLLIFFIISTMPLAYAQAVVLMPPPGTMVPLSAKFEPVLMAGLQFDPKNPFKFNFLFQRGQESLADDVRRQEYRKIVKYFLAALTIPNTDMWVNLSPYEHGWIIPDNFGLTEMGRDLLAQDYLLKQVTASLIHPDQGVGRDFWRRVYQKASEKYGTTNIPLDTFNKVWIVPDMATLYHQYDTAIIVENHLKVLTEQDYLAAARNRGEGLPGSMPVDQGSKTAGFAAVVAQEIVVPFLEKEVNEGKGFAPLRQAYSAMLMATWFKKSLKESVLGQVYADQSKVAGIRLDDPQEKEKIYQKYLQAYAVGAFNFVKEEFDPLTREIIPRKYFSGGTIAYRFDQAQEVALSGQLTSAQRDRALKAYKQGMDKVAVNLDAAQENEGQGQKFELTPAQRALLGEKGMKRIRMAIDDSGDIFYKAAGPNISFFQQLDGKEYVFDLMDGALRVMDMRTIGIIKNNDEVEGFKQRIREKILSGNLFFGDGISEKVFKALGLARMKFDWEHNGQDMPAQADFIRSLEKGLLIELDISGMAPAQDGKFLVQIESTLGTWCDIVAQRHLLVPVAYGIKEIVKNAIVHGNQMDFKRPIYISFDKDLGAFDIWDTANPQKFTGWTPRGWSGSRAGEINLSKNGKYGLERIKGLTRARFIPYKMASLVISAREFQGMAKPSVYQGLASRMTEKNKFGSLLRVPGRVVDFAGKAGDGTEVWNKGGIDFNTDRLNMNIKRDGNGMPLPWPMQDPVLEHIEGLSPTILDITSADAMPIFNELNYAYKNPG